MLQSATRASNNAAYRGVGFLLARRPAPTSSSFSPSRIVQSLHQARRAQRRAHLGYLCLHIYAPTAIKSLTYKSELYDLLTTSVDGLPSYCLHVFSADFNAMMPPESAHAQASYGYSDKNSPEVEESAQLLSSFANMTSLFSAGTCAKRYAQQGRQIDHILLKDRRAKWIRNVKTVPNAVNSGHHMVLLYLHVRFAITKHREKPAKKDYRLLSSDPSVIPTLLNTTTSDQFTAAVQDIPAKLPSADRPRLDPLRR